MSINSQAGRFIANITRSMFSWTPQRPLPTSAYVVATVSHGPTAGSAVTCAVERTG